MVHLDIDTIIRLSHNLTTLGSSFSTYARVTGTTGGTVRAIQISNLGISGGGGTTHTHSSSYSFSASTITVLHTITVNTSISTPSLVLSSLSQITLLVLTLDSLGVTGTTGGTVSHYTGLVILGHNWWWCTTSYS